MSDRPMTKSEAPVYVTGMRMINAARNDGHANLFWVVGHDVPREVISASVSFTPTSEEIAAVASRRTRDGDFQFCGLPAFVDAGLPPLRITLMRSDELASEDL